MHTLSSLFKAIADAIREKTGVTEDIPASEFPERIANFPMKDLFVEIATGTVKTIEYGELDGLTKIPFGSFTGCSELESIVIPSSVTDIAENVFNGCDKLTIIKVPWGENEKYGAPWGADNATVIYNYGGE